MSPTTDPGVLHAAILARLDKLTDRIALATPGPWAMGNCVNPLDLVNIHNIPHADLVADHVGYLDAELIVALHSAAAAVTAGRRNILERHRPHSSSSYAATVCLSCEDPDSDRPAPWPCADYRDAAANLMPETPPCPST